MLGALSCKWSLICCRFRLWAASLWQECSCTLYSPCGNSFPHTFWCCRDNLGLTFTYAAQIGAHDLLTGGRWTDPALHEIHYLWHFLDRLSHSEHWYVASHFLCFDKLSRCETVGDSLIVLNRKPFLVEDRCFLWNLWRWMAICDYLWEHHLSFVARVIMDVGVPACSNI